MQERLQKIIAQSGMCSRRKAEELIILGKVKINGKTAKIGEKADSEKDKILVGDQELKKEKKVYFMMNKPKGYVCTLTRQGKQKIISDLIKEQERIFPIGRLDKDTTGLLLLTNNGDFANFITHPSKETTKTYVAQLNKKITEEDLIKLKKGIIVEGRKTEIKNIQTTKEGKEIKLKIHEGRKHIVKKLFEKIGYYVVGLKRTEINNLKIDVEEGEYRKLEKEDFKKLGFVKN